MLLLATIFWGLSFPTMKALTLAQQEMLPGASSWFITSLALLIRFGAAAIVVALWNWRLIRSMTRLELWEGAGLGFFGGIGILFQMDGLAYTSASTSAFLTQAYCLLLPIIVCARERRWPSWVVFIGSAMVVSGVAILSGIDWNSFKMGRGELETLIGSIIFTAQILWLDRPLFRKNRVEPFTVAMFAMMVLVCAPVTLATRPPSASIVALYGTAPVLVLMSVLVVCCTLVAYVMMNRWQPHLPASEAGLIYAAEPVFASVFALFLPGFYSLMAGIGYSNERLTFHLLVGGGLISLANVLIQLFPEAEPGAERAAPG
jgi:drug/metabolite transporter (DMT)-like permease